MYWVNQPKAYKQGFSDYSFCTDVVNVKKAGHKTVKLGSSKALNPCESSFSIPEVVVHSFLSPGDRVLNLCAGLGMFEEVCVVNGINVVALEKHKDMARAAIQHLESLPNTYKAGFQKAWKIPTCELMPVAIAPNTRKAYRKENFKGYLVHPYVASGEAFSVLSSGSFRGIMVCAVCTPLPFCTKSCVFFQNFFSLTPPP